MNKFGRRVTGAIALLFTALPLSAAEISVPSLELATTGSVEDGAFVLATRASAELSVDGGYKFGGTLRFAFSANDLEKALSYLTTPLTTISAAPDADDYNALVDRINNSASLSFKLAKVMVRQPFGAPIDFGFFVGQADTFCSGDDFPTRFGSAPIGTAFRGYAYFPDGIGGDPNFQYNGIHGATGTGISLSWTAWDRIVPILYAYQDSAIESGTSSGKYSADLRLLANGDNVKIELFAGLTQPSGSLGLYRAGALAYFSTGVGADFLAQVGIPRWNPDEGFGIDNLFFLFEPRVDFGFSSIIMTLFYHPAWYFQRETDERGVSDVNLKFLIGDLRKTSIEGGFETTIGIRGEAQASEQPFRLSLGPFFAMVTEGVRWDVKLKVNPIAATVPLEMFEMFLGVRTGF